MFIIQFSNHTFEIEEYDVTKHSFNCPIYLDKYCLGIRQTVGVTDSTFEDIYLHNNIKKILYFEKDDDDITPFSYDRALIVLERLLSNYKIEF